MKFGFEREFFAIGLLNEPVLVPSGLPKDECGFLLEARGEPHTDPISAMYLLMAKEERLRKLAESRGLRLDDSSHLLLPKKLRVEAMRTFGKNPVTHERRNLYGRTWPSDRWSRAGLHIHFSNERTINLNPGTATVNQFFDPIPLIRKLDERFKNLIKIQKRIPGEYELKPYGFEYRSLGASASLMEVAWAVCDIVNS